MNKNVFLVLVALLMANLAFARQELSWKDGKFHINGVAVGGNKFKGGLRGVVEGARVSVLDALPGSSQNYLVYVSRPARRLPLSRCGAGTEETLILLSYGNAGLVLLDKIDVHSCERNMLLTNKDMELPLDPLSFVEIRKDCVDFWITRPLDSPGSDDPVHRRYKIVRNRFVLQP